MNLLQTFNFLNMITEGLDEYQEEYKQYVIDHKERVSQFSSWLQKECPDLFENIDIEVFNDLIAEHDESKFSEEEFEPYAQKWFGDGKKTREYELAWEHHYMNNEHHPEYWDGEDMPYIYILEMICDWGSFSIASGDMKELSDFYYSKAKEDPEKNLSEATQDIIENILSCIDSVISREELDEWVYANGNKVTTSKASTATNTKQTTNSNLTDHYKELFRQVLECARHKVVKHDLSVSPTGESFNLTLSLADSSHIIVTYDIPTRKWTFKYNWYSDVVDDCDGESFSDLLAKLSYHNITDRFNVWEYSNPDFIHEFRKYDL
jgi:hypothetical protein